MALPLNLILESQDHAFYTHFRSQDVKFGDTKATFIVTFVMKRPDTPAKAFMKIYRGAEVGNGQVEVQRLQAAAFCPAVLRCHYSFQHKDEVYLFLEYCERGSLKDEIRRRNRAKLWRESKLLFLFTTLAAALVQLHGHQISPTRLKARNIFFTEDKDIRLSSFSAKPGMRNNDSEIFLEDIRRLCWTFFETAACEVFSAQSSVDGMKETIKTRYSPEMSEFLLTAIKTHPVTAEQLLSKLEAMNTGRVSIELPLALPKCLVCARYFSTCVRLPCEHSYCEECLSQRMVACANAGTPPGEAACGICSAKLGLAVVERALQFLPENIRRFFEQWADGQVTGQCPYCGAEFPILKLRKRGKWRPYDLKCGCKKRFCTYCGLRGGHKIILFNRRCYAFEKRQLKPNTP